MEEEKNPNLTWFKFEIDFQIPKHPQLLELQNADEILKMAETMFNTTSNLCSTVVNVMLAIEDETERQRWWNCFEKIRQTMDEYIITGTEMVLNKAIKNVEDEDLKKEMKEALNIIEEIR